MVLIIAGVLAGTMIPVLSYFSGVRNHQAVSMLADHLRYIRDRAMASRLKTWIVLDASTENYVAYIEDSGNLGKANRIALVNPLTRENINVTLDTDVSGGVDISSVSINGGSEVEFDSFGQPYDTSSTALSSDGTITFDDGTSIKIVAVAGHIYISP